MSRAGQALIWGRGASRIDAVRNADTETDPSMIALVHANGGVGFELVDDSWIVVAEADESDLDSDQAVRGYSHDALTR